MTGQETSTRRYMATLADEINKCSDPVKVQRLAMELTRMKSLLDRIENEKEGSKDK